jgi:hypothetical protein
MKKANARVTAGFFCGSDTELTTPKQESQRRKRACGLVDGIIKGERVLIHKPAREMSEKAIEIQIRTALAAAHVFVQKHNIDRRSPFGSGLGIGVADLICVVPPYGRFLGIEVKRPSTRDHLSEDQQRFAATIRRFGGVCGVATSVDEAFELVEKARRLP